MLSKKKRNALLQKILENTRMALFTKTETLQKLNTMIKDLLIIMIILFLPNEIFAQSNYLNISYNPNNTWATGVSIIESAGNYYISGNTLDSVFVDNSIYIAKIESNGNLIFWKTHIGYPYTYCAGITSLIINTTYGDLVLAGGRNSNNGINSQATYFNFNQYGDTNYTKSYPDSNYLDFTGFYQCKQTSDNGLVFVGVNVIGKYDTDVFMVKTNYSGEEEWRRNYDLEAPYSYSLDKGYCVLETEDSGYLIGLSHSYAFEPESKDPFLLKVNNQGEIQWELNLGGPFADNKPSICKSHDGNFMCAVPITDTTEGNFLFSKVNIIKISDSGNIMWTKKIGLQYQWNNVSRIYQDHNEGYIICGWKHEYEKEKDLTNCCGWICKIDDVGDSVWWREYKHQSNPEWQSNKLYDIALTSDGGYIAVGETETEYTPQQTWVIKVDSFGCDTPGCQIVKIQEQKNILNKSLNIYPNPATEKINCQIIGNPKRNIISIYNLIGMKQDEVAIPENQNQIQIDVSKFPSGIYMAVLKDGRKVIAQRKFVVKK